MSVWHYSSHQLGMIALYTGADPELLAIISEANTRCYRDRYGEKAKDAQAATEQQIWQTVAAGHITQSDGRNAIDHGTRLGYNCNDVTDCRTTDVMRALAECMEAVAATASIWITPSRGFPELEQYAIERRRAARERLEPRKHAALPVYSTATVERTGNHVAAYARSFTDSVRVGDSVCDDIYWQLLEALPPAFSSPTLMQMGEPQTHGDNGHPLFITLQRGCDKRWYYTGILVRGAHVKLM